MTQMQVLFSLSLLVPLGLLALALVGYRGCLRGAAFDAAPARDAGLGLPDLLIALAMMLIGMFAAGAVVQALISALSIAPNGEAGAPLSPQAQAIAMLVSPLLAHGPVALYLLFKALNRDHGLMDVGFVPRAPRREVVLAGVSFAVALALVLAVNSISTALVFYAGLETPSVGHAALQAMRDADSRLVLAAMLLSAVVLAPVFEEIVYRGLMQTALLDLLGPGSRWAAIAVTSAGFALVHAQAVPWHLLPSLFVLAMVLGWVYEKTGSLLPCVLMHALFNAANILLMVLLDGMAA
jgi:membrane protease YdiL (CAAX protease family)